MICIPLSDELSRLGILHTAPRLPRPPYRQKCHGTPFQRPLSPTVGNPGRTRPSDRTEPHRSKAVTSPSQTPLEEHSAVGRTHRVDAPNLNQRNSLALSCTGPETMDNRETG